MKSSIHMIVSFLLISLVIILALAGGAYVLYGDYSRAQIEDQFWISFSAAQAQADKLLEDINSYALQLGDISVFSAAEPMETGARTAQLSSLIQKYHDHAKFDAEAAILLRRTPQYIYTANGKITYSDYENHLQQSDVNPNMDKLFSGMLASQRAQLQHISGGSKLLHIIPIGNMWLPYDATLMVLMEQSVLTDCFTRMEALQSSGIYAVGSNGSLVLEKVGDSGQPMTAQDLSGLLTNGIKSKVINGVEMVIACKTSDTGLLMYMSMLPENEFYGNWYVISNRLMVIILTVVCFAIIMSVVMGIANYLPLRKAYKRITGLPPKWRADDLQLIINYFEKTQNNISELEDRQETNLGIIRRQLLLSMINNHILSEQEFENYKKSLQLKLDKPWWCALFISDLLDENGKSHIDRILQALEDLYLPEAEMIFTEQRWEHGVSAVINFSAEDPSVAIAVIARDIMKRLQWQSSGLPLALGVGSIEREPKHISMSFYRATSVAHSIQPSCENRIVFYKEAQSDASFVLDTSLLVEGITYGNTEVALTSFNMAIAQMENSREYLPMIRLMCSDILNTIIHYAHKQNLPLDQPLVYAAAESTTLDEFTQHATPLIEQICALSGQHRIEDSRQGRMQLIAYIADHYMSNELSLQLLSDEMKMSMSKINLLLKESTGCSFLQYIWLLRCNEFKRLLRETNNNIQSIVQMVGYIDVSSFLRKFKASEGISPGQYRQRYREKLPN